MGVSSRTTRNSLLAGAAAIGVVATVLQVVASSLSFGDFLKFPGFTSLKVASGLSLLGWVIVLAAFGVALAAFLLRSRGTRTTVLAVSAGLFAGSGLASLAAVLIDLIQSWGSPFEPWEFKADGVAQAAAAACLALAALLVLIGLLSARPDGLLGWGSVGLAGYFGFLAAAFSFNLAGYQRFFHPIPGEISWGLGTHAGGHLVEAVAALLAAAAFFGASARRARREPWAARREGSLEIAAIVFAVGFLFVSVGLMLLASQIGDNGRQQAEYWLQAVGQLLLAFAAACGAVGFFRSRRDAERRGRLEDGDGPDLSALADPG
jgi:hypothetical protein